MKKMLRVLPILGGLVVLPLFTGCPDQVDNLKESAKFLLDQCNPTTNDSAILAKCTDAATASTDLITADPTGVDGPIFNSSAHLGLAGIDFLQVTAELADLNTSGTAGTDDFAEFRALIATIESDNGRAIDLAELDLAKSALTTLLASAPTADDDTKRAYFQLGLVQVIDGFIRPTKLAGAGAANLVGAGGIIVPPATFTATSGINLANATLVNDAFVAADNNLVSANTSDTDFLDPIRQNFCFCKAQGASGSGVLTAEVATTGLTMTPTCIRDLMRCELISGITTTTALENNYDGVAGTDGSDCATLLSTAAAAFTTCTGAGNTTP